MVLNDANEFGRPFAVLLPLKEVEHRTREWRVQYQVSFRNDLVASAEEAGQVVVFGSGADLPPESS